METDVVSVHRRRSRGGRPDPAAQEAKLAALSRVVNAPAERSTGDLVRELAGTAVLVALLVTTTGGLLAAVLGALWLLS